MTSAEPTVSEILQQVQFELYRDNVEGALDILDRAFDLVYSFAALEHVRDVDEAVAAVRAVLRPGGRFCFVVPMNEFKVAGELPHFESDGHAGHVRVFTEAGLRERFGASPDFALGKIPGDLPERFPAALAPIEFGSFFVTLSKPR